MTAKILALFFFCASSIVQAQNFENFNKRFEVVRKDSGEIHYVKAKGVAVGFQLAPYVEGIKKELIDLRDRLMGLQSMGLNSETPEEFIDRFLDEIEIDSFQAQSEVQTSLIYDQKAVSQMRRSYLKEAYLNLPNVDINRAFRKIAESKVISKFRQLLEKFYLQRKLNIIAVPGDSNFYYQQKVTNTVMRESIAFLRKRVSETPILEIASFILGDLMARLEEQREIAQNIFLYYVINFEDKLDFSPKELDRLISSIYEARIPVSGFMESRRAAQIWLDFGWAKYDAFNRAGKSKMRMMRPYYQSATHRFYTFYDVVEGGVKKLVNTALTAHMFTSRPAVSIYYDQPNRIRMTRTLVGLGQAALGFLPGVPSFIKSSVNSFANSWYREQRKYDAFVYAYFEAKKNDKAQTLVKRQLANPFFDL